MVLAGGRIFGQKAFLVHYHSAKFNWIFSPPFTIASTFPSVFNLIWRALSINTTHWHFSPFVREYYDNKRGVLILEVNDLWRKLVIDVHSTEVGGSALPSMSISISSRGVHIHR
jgi:hypothetical protein